MTLWYHLRTGEEEPINNIVDVNIIISYIFEFKNIIIPLDCVWILKYWI